MDNKLKQKWIDALRSGRYIQGKKFLKRSVNDAPKYCCLGVLCEIEGKEWNLIADFTNNVMRYDVQSPEDKVLVYAAESSVGMLPEHTRILVGLPSSIEHELIRMNDQGTDFNEIANYIERRVPDE